MEGAIIPRSRGAGYVTAVGGIALVTAVCGPFRERINHTTVALAMLLVVLVVAAQWGSWPAFVASIVGVLCFNFFFLPPVYTFTIADPQNWVALAAFLVTSVVAGQLWAREKRRSAEAEAGRATARRASAYNRSLIEASLDAMVAIGQNGAITDVNAAAEAMTGRTRAELIGTEFAEYFTEPERAGEVYRQAFREGIVRDHTLKLRRRGGDTVPVLYNATVYRDETGEVLGVFAVARPAAESTGLGRTSAVRAFPPPSGAVARSGADMAARGAAASPTGVPVPGSRLRPVLGMLPSVAALGLQWVVWPFIRPFAWLLVYPAVFASSSVGGLASGLGSTALCTVVVWWFFVWPAHASNPRQLLSAGVFASMGVLFSVFHERLQKRTNQANAALVAARSASEQVAHAKDEIARLVEQASDAILVADLDGRYTDVNGAACLMLGRSREAIVGKTLFDLMPPEDARRFWQAKEELLEGGVQIAEWTLLGSDGAPIPVEISAKVLPDGRWQALVRDISERKRAEGQIHLLARLQAVVADLGQRALRSGPLGDLLEEGASVVARALEVEYSEVLERLADGATLLLRSGVGYEPELIGYATVPGGTSSQAGFTLLSDKPVVVDDLGTESRFRGSLLLRDHGIVSGMSVPVSTTKGPFGVLAVHTRQPRLFGREEVDFLQGAANVLGLAIERKRAEDDLLRINRAHRALSSCNQALIRATDEATWVSQVCEFIVQEAGYRFCWVGRAESDEARTVKPIAHAGFDDGYLDTANITWADTERGRGPTGTCIRTGETQLVKNFATDARLGPWRAQAIKRGYASSIAIPLGVDSKRFGALTIYSGEVEAFGDEEVNLLTELAGDMGYGITTLRTRVERNRAQDELRQLNVDLEKRVAARTAELEAAREREMVVGLRIQQMLLLNRPPLDVPGLHVAALTNPSQQIDGDFYDFYRHEDQCLDVIVADVMGKGIPAALLGAATKNHFIEALCHLMGSRRDGLLPQPKEIVTQAHAEMVQHLIELESFVTACYVRFDPGKKSLTLVDCGHTGLLHWHAATGTCEMLHGDNLPLGVREGEMYSQRSVLFEAGDVVLLFSDGVTEARDRNGEIFGDQRLARCLQANSAAEPRDLVEAVRKAAIDFSGAALPRDDLTCVAIRVVQSELPLARSVVELRSDLRDLARARQFVRDVCAGVAGAAGATTRPLDAESVEELELAVTEACSNIVRHAYHGRDDQWIRLEAEAYPDSVSLYLHYLGDRFDPAGIAPPALDGSRDSGFGVFLITKCVDDVRYFRDERGRNCITLIKRRGT